MSQPPSPARRILAAGLSPAWQQIMVFDEFRPGEVNRARDVHQCGSGKVLNVGIALAHLARKTQSPVECRTLSVIGPRARAAIEPEFAALGVDCRWIETAAETRICTTILDRATGRTTELVENAVPLGTDEVERFRHAFAEEAAGADVVVLTGSLPHVALRDADPSLGGSHVAASLRDADPSLGETRLRGLYRNLLESVWMQPTSYGAFHAPYAVLDIRGPELLAALDCRPLCVKPNREELANTIGREICNDNDLHAAMRELNDRGAQWVVVTHGAGPVFASHDGQLFRLTPPRIDNVVNPIASGDCLAAGIAWSVAHGMEMLEAIRFGIAAATDNVGQVLPARLNIERVRKLVDSVACRRG